MCRVPTFAAVRLLAGLVGIVIACMLSGHVQAAKISCISARYSNVEGLNELYPGKGPKLTPNDCVEIYIEGDIGKGDYQAFVSLLRIAEPHVREVSIISPGGDVTEAIKIGEVIRGRMLETQTAYRGDKGIYKLPSMGPDGLEYRCKGSDCLCASACFLVWSAGINRDGDALMVHRPRDSSGTFGAKAAARASHEYGSVLKIVSDYLVRMEVPAIFIELIMKTSSTDSLLLPKSDVSDDLEGYTSTIAEWLIADCGALTSEEENYLRALRIAKYEYGYKLNDDADRYLIFMNDKDWKIRQCNVRKLTAERIRIANEVPL